MKVNEAIAFVIWCQSNDIGWREIAERFRVSRATAYRWIGAYRRNVEADRALNRLASAKWA